MLVRFDSKAGQIKMFGDVAVKLLRMMGQSGAVPGAILAADVPAAVERLRQSVGIEPAGAGEKTVEEGDAPVALSQRAFPLIELLERSAKSSADVIWEDESKAV